MKQVNFIIVGEAKSAGTIFAISGNDIYMTETGSLGPIGAQLKIGGQFISTRAYLEWVNSVKSEAEKSGKLNSFDATVVAQISPSVLNGVGGDSSRPIHTIIGI